MYISAVTLYNINVLLEEIVKMLDKLPPMKIYEQEYLDEDYSKPADKSVNISKNNGVYEVESDWLYNFMQTINFSDRESLMYFQKVLRDNGVIEELEKSGCKEGDTVSIYDFEFEFVE